MDWYGPAADPAWQEALGRLAPRTEYGHSWLKLMWEPGEVWAPVNRWVIWEMMPVHRAPFAHDVQRELLGPNPRNFGYYDRVLRRFKRINHPLRPTLINRRQWVEFRESGCYGRCIWVIQGSHGGHKRFFSDIESNISMMAGGPAEPPEPGELPYAELDNRTIEKLRAIDLVLRFGDVLDKLTSNHAAVPSELLDRRELAVAQEMARQLWGWLDSQVGELELTRSQVARIWENADPDAAVPDFDAGVDEFINDVALGYA